MLIGSNTFIPGFEDQLIGVTSGETRTLKVTFPKHYMKQELAGKDAEFVVTAKSVETPGTVVADDAFAQSLGLESLAKLRDAVKDNIAREHSGMSRQKLKRGLLDDLDKMHKFEPPPTLVEEEFDRVWKSVLSELETEHKTFADEGTTEEKAKAEYRAIAERRVRLGLVLAEIGEKNNITVTEEELSSRRDGACALSLPVRSSACGTITARIHRRLPPCERRSSRKRWLISCSSLPA